MTGGHQATRGKPGQPVQADSRLPAQADHVGRAAAGRTLPSEERLVQESGTARSTVRRAIALLRDEGWIETVQVRAASFALTTPPVAV